MDHNNAVPVAVAVHAEGRQLLDAKNAKAFETITPSPDGSPDVKLRVVFAGSVLTAAHVMKAIWDVDLHDWDDNTFYGSVTPETPAFQLAATMQMIFMSGYSDLIDYTCDHIANNVTPESANYLGDRLEADAELKRSAPTEGAINSMNETIEALEDFAVTSAQAMNVSQFLPQESAHRIVHSVLVSYNQIYVFRTKFVVDVCADIVNTLEAFHQF